METIYLEIFREIMLEIQELIQEGEIDCEELLDDTIYNATMHEVSYDIDEEEIKQCLIESETVGHIIESWK